MHERNEDKSWTFRTANSEGTVNPVPLPQSLTVQYTVKRTMRLVIQAPPEGSGLGAGLQAFAAAPTRC